VARGVRRVLIDAMHVWLYQFIRVIIHASVSLVFMLADRGGVSVYQTYYSTHFLTEYAPGQISWIGSIQIFFLYFGGCVSGPLADRFGYKVRS